MSEKIPIEIELNKSAVDTQKALAEELATHKQQTRRAQENELINRTFMFTKRASKDQ